MAPIANRNAVRHGLRAGSLPKGSGYIKRDTEALRRTLEDCVAEQHNGNVSLYHGALINTAIKWERHSMLVQRWLRLEAGSMDAATRLAYSRDVAKAATERDKCLRELGLNRDFGADVISALYAIEHKDESENDH